MAKQIHLNGFIKVPCNNIIFGGSFSGKTTLITEIIRYRSYIFDHQFSAIYFCYEMYQPNYDELKEMGVICYNGVPSLEQIKKWSDVKDKHILLIFDDLAETLISKECITDTKCLFTILGHHAKITIFLLTHNLFYPNFRTISLSTHNFFLMKMLRDKSTLINLSKQSFPGKSATFLKIYDDALKESSQYPNKPPYILVKMNPFDTNDYQIITNIFPYQRHTVYIMD